jgi:4-oxalmesaconate hydratase
VRDPETGRALNDIKPLVEAIEWLTAADRARVYEDNARDVFSRLGAGVTAAG